MRWILLVFLLISCTDNSDEEMKLFINSLSSGSSIPSIPENGVRVFLITGQSNARGRAPNSSATSEELLPQPQMQIWNNGSSVFQDLRIGVNSQDIINGDHSIELGLSQSFNTYFPNETGYIIKYAVSSTPIRYHIPEDGTVYNVFKERVESGINNLINQGKIPYVYFIYSQGERDANPDSDAAGDTPSAHLLRFKTLLDLWQTNLGTDLPFVAYETLDFYTGSLEVNSNMLSYEGVTYPHYKMLPMVNETDIGDGLHFDYQAHKNASIKSLDFFQNNLGQPVESLISL